MAEEPNVKSVNKTVVKAKPMMQKAVPNRAQMLMQMKSPAYDSSNTLNLNFNRGFDKKKYVKSEHKTTEILSSQPSPETSDTDEEGDTTNTNPEGEEKGPKIVEVSVNRHTTIKVLSKSNSPPALVVPTKPAPKTTSDPPSSKQYPPKPFALAGLKSPTYDSSQQLNVALDDEFDKSKYKHEHHKQEMLQVDNKVKNLADEPSEEKEDSDFVSELDTEMETDLTDELESVRRQDSEELLLCDLSEDSEPTREIKVFNQTPRTVQPIQLKPKPRPMQQKPMPGSGAARPKAFNMMNMKSPTYDSSKNLSLALDTNFDNNKYMKEHVSKEQTVNHEGVSPGPPRIQLMEGGLSSSEELTGEPDTPEKKETKPEERSKKPMLGPGVPRPKAFNLMSMKSPAYDSSKNLSLALDNDFQKEKYLGIEGKDVHTRVRSLSTEDPTPPPSQDPPQSKEKWPKEEKSRNLSPTEPTKLSSGDREIFVLGPKSNPTPRIQQQQPRKIQQKPKIIPGKVARPFDFRSMKSTALDSSKNLSLALDKSFDKKKYMKTPETKPRVRRLSAESDERKKEPYFNVTE